MKAKAIRATLESDVMNLIPATILKSHPNWSLYLDNASASLLPVRTVAAKQEE
ncbi:glucosamine-6-phosphate deaminase [compost metagenome]